MFDIKDIEKNKFFKERDLKSGEILFDEGDFDQNIYIIKSGKLKVEKYFSEARKEKKSLAILEKNSIFGEGALSNNNPKEVIISALDDSKLIYIESKDFQKFILENTELAINFLSQIIEISNKRLLESNFLLTSNYNISKMISEKREFSNKNLFAIIDEFLKIIKAKYIVYAEINEILNNYINIIYDTRTSGKKLNKISEIKDFEINLRKLDDLDLSPKNMVVELKNGNKIVGFFIIGERDEKAFSESEKKSINSIGVLLAGFIKQKQYFQNEKNQEN